MIRPLTSRERKILIFTLAVVICSLFYNGLIGPIYEKEESLDREILATREQLELDLRILAGARTLDERYHAYLAQFRRSGTEEEVAASILSEIEGVAGRFGLHVIDLKPRKIEHGIENDQFSISLTVNSKLTDVIRFLYVLQLPPYSFDVEEADFEKLERRDEDTITTRLVLGKAFITSDSGKNQTEKKGMALVYGHD